MITRYIGNLVKDPCHLVRKLLDIMFSISEYTHQHSYHSNVCIDENNMESEKQLSNIEITNDIHNLWIEFMDGISLLQCIDISSMDFTSNDMLCLFLNLYHCLLLHSYLIVGHPMNLLKW